MKTSRQTNRKKYGPNIVRAWFDTFFQYALERLASERTLLVDRKWTFRFYNRSLEYIATLGEHMPLSARENLEQFLSFYPAVEGLLAAHDRGVGRLLEACTAFHDAIIRHPRFQGVFESVAAEAPAALGADFSSHFGALSSMEDFAGIIAEYLVNNFEDLPNYYATSRLWNRYRTRFAEAIATTELEPFRLNAETAGRELLEAVDKLSNFLKSNRSKLSLEFDVPFATETASAR